MSGAAILLACPRELVLSETHGPAGFHPPRYDDSRSAAGQGGVHDRLERSHLGALAVLGAAALWFHYGTAVFFEMIAAGISACF